ncbi:recombinase RecT [Acetobacter thailandicus]|uniref:recombinase RecT n=1 Tax=Acetobacter thailandicus TaxID=1502842 RepID=UPI001BA4893E|nr:recombinase RecT [Acetobacter thailandicus]MBS1003202.1 recombinase RecT [Acetobacter thailandicus]
MSGTLVTQGSNSTAIQITSFDQLQRFAQIASKSGMVPTQYINKPDAVFIAVQMGSELGLAPLQSLQNIAVINGRPSIWGDALLGLVKASAVCDDVIESIEGDGDNMVAICVAKRKGKSPVTSRFSVQDAKSAGLWGKTGPWKQYPSRMLQMRARGFALRDAFPDVLRGLITAEEAQDIPSESIRSEDTTPERAPAKQIQAPVDYIKIFSGRLDKCVHASGVDHEWSIWESTIQKAEEAGRPIAPEIQSTVFDMIGDKRSEFSEQVAEEQIEEVVA